MKLNAKKKLLSLAVTNALVATGAVAYADSAMSATVHLDMTATNSPALKFASEIVVDDSAWDAGIANGIEFTAAMANMGYGMANDTSFWTRLDLEGAGATFAATNGYAGGVYTADDLSGSSKATLISAQRASSDTSVMVYEFKTGTSSGDTTLSTDAVGMGMTKTGVGLNLTSKDSVTATYSLYELTASSAIQGTDSNRLAGPTAREILNFDSSAIDFIVEPKTSTVDVTKQSLVFQDETEDGTVVASLGTFSIDDADDVLLGDGSPASATSVIDVASDADIAVIGDMSAVDAIYIGSGCSTSVNASTTFTIDAAAGEAVFNVGNMAASGEICFVADGVNPLQDTTYEIEYRPTAEAGYEVNDVKESFGVFEKNGSTADVMMLLAPDSQYRQLMRISNPTAQSGKVHITAYDDDGNKAPNTWSFDLEAGKSTGLINSQQVVDNTGVTSASATNGNKIRIHVEAEFGSDYRNTTGVGIASAPALPNNRVQVRTYALSKDRNSFSQFD